jgi:MOSC domain-containing protein YiiM
MAACSKRWLPKYEPAVPPMFAALRRDLGLPDAQPEATRRNVFTNGIELGTLIGQEFEVLGVRFAGVDECWPCYWMDEAIGPGSNAWLRGRGGPRAQILSNGWLHCHRRSTAGTMPSLMNPTDYRLAV